MYLTEGAQSWLRQLGRDTYNSYAKIRHEFIRFFCQASRDKAADYYSMTRKIGENPIDYLWRMNVAAKEAKIDIVTTTKAQEAHVHPYLMTIESNSLRYYLRGCLKVVDLEKALKDVEELRRRDPRPEEWEREDKEKAAAKSHKNHGQEHKAYPVVSVRQYMDPEEVEVKPAEEVVALPTTPVSYLVERCYQEDYQALEDFVAYPTNLIRHPEKEPCKKCGNKYHQADNCWKGVKCNI